MVEPWRACRVLLDDGDLMRDAWDREIASQIGDKLRKECFKNNEDENSSE